MGHLEEDVSKEYYIALLLPQLKQLIAALFDNPDTSKVIGDIAFIVEGEEVDLTYAKEFLLSVIDAVEAKSATD